MFVCNAISEPSDALSEARGSFRSQWLCCDHLCTMLQDGQAPQPPHLVYLQYSLFGDRSHRTSRSPFVHYSRPALFRQITDWIQSDLEIARHQDE